MVRKSKAPSEDAAYDVIFLHANRAIIKEGEPRKTYYCGGETCRPDGSKQQLAGGMKTLWLSGQRQNDTALVITEGSIDALSYAALHPSEHTRFASTGGNMNTDQPKHLIRVMKRMPQGAEIILAFDNDKRGYQLEETVRELYEKHVLPEREDLRLRVDRPEPPLGHDGKYDWNDALKDAVRTEMMSNAPRARGPAPGM